VRLTTRTAGLAVTLACAVAGFTPAAGQARADAAAGSLGGAPVRHVIEIMLENHTFDNLFPGGASGGRQPLTAPPNEGDVQGGIDNGRAAELKAMDYQPGRGYLMDRYTDPPFGPRPSPPSGPVLTPTSSIWPAVTSSRPVTSSR
jgi:phospholipase C